MRCAVRRLPGHDDAVNQSAGHKHKIAAQPPSVLLGPLLERHRHVRERLPLLL